MNPALLNVPTRPTPPRGPNPDFVEALLATDPRTLTGIGQAFAPSRTLQHQRALRGTALGADRFARDLCIQVWAIHGLHATGSGVAGALGRAVASGDLNESRALNLLRAPRAGLHLHLAPVAELLARSRPPALSDMRFADLTPVETADLLARMYAGDHGDQKDAASPQERTELAAYLGPHEDDRASA